MFVSIKNKNKNNSTYNVGHITNEYFTIVFNLVHFIIYFFLKNVGRPLALYFPTSSPNSSSSNFS